MTRPAIQATAIGRERQPLVTIDHFAADPDRLRAAAIAARFGPADQHYPGLRAPLPADYWQEQEPLVSDLVRNVFGLYGRVHLVDASFSLVTTPPSQLSVKQRLPHVDAFGAGRLAFVHYLCPEGGDGTAFFRHRSTGFETVNEARAPAYFDRVASELAETESPPAYVAGDTPFYECTTLGEARYNRALLYRSFMLHSGAIRPDVVLSPDPARGRLTVTAFLSVE